MKRLPGQRHSRLQEISSTPFPPDVILSTYQHLITPHRTSHLPPPFFLYLPNTLCFQFVLLRSAHLFFFSIIPHILSPPSEPSRGHHSKSQVFFLYSLFSLLSYPKPTSFSFLSLYSSEVLQLLNSFPPFILPM